MSSDDTIPLGQFKATCPQCGAELSIKHDSGEFKGDERMICPVHGDVGSLEEVRRVVFGKPRDKIVDQAKKVAIDRIRDSFRKIFK